ncbi:hypothetical protein SMC26_10180 [Actinomadura fulvescens]|uniref:Uncharacterized protein n=1 Tax=Actinomadura fulvescens TaxID=46160 RepID=A0ABN3Q1G0_9ACTN
MRTYHYKIQTSTFGLFVGITAEALPSDAPPAIGEQISDRIWLDTSQVSDTFRDMPLTLSENETRWLRFGLEKVADQIEHADGRYIRIVVRALEIVEADYAEATLAPALAGWAAAEYGLTPPRGHTTLDTSTRQRTFHWDD